VTDPVKLKGALPKDDIANGLWRMADDLSASPRRRRVAVIVFDVMTTVTEHEVTEDGEALDTTVPVVRVRAIEALGGEEEETARRMLIRAREGRQSRVTLFTVDNP
jgi:hypothetical protein